MRDDFFIKVCYTLRESGRHIFTVTFCEHNEMNIGEKIQQWLYHTVEQEIKNGTTMFYLGGY